MNNYEGWTSISERLPEEGDTEILALVKSNDFAIAVPHVVTFRNGVWYTTASNPIEEYLDAKVTHWQPMSK